jgi:hypothetical protein
MQVSFNPTRTNIKNIPAVKYQKNIPAVISPQSKQGI